MPVTGFSSHTMTAPGHQTGVTQYHDGNMAEENRKRNLLVYSDCFHISMAQKAGN